MTKEANLAVRLKSIIDTAIDGIVIIDNKGIIEDMNRAAAEMFGYSSEEVVGKNVKMLMPEPRRSEHDGYISNYHETRVPKIIGIGRDVVGLKKNGVLFDLRLAVSEVILHDRVIFTGILHDLTQVKEAEGKLIRMNEILEKKVDERTLELEAVVNRLLSTNRRLERSEEGLKSALNKEMELNELKSRFVSMASHEFRTPLSTILSSAALISRYPESYQFENREKHVKRIKSAVANLTGILNDFLSLSKLEEGHKRAEIEEINLHGLCATVADEIEGLLRKGQVISHTHEGNKMVYTDERIMRNILFNLVSNAIKYSPPNTTISCKVKADDNRINIDIIDQGIGIPKNEQKHLFNRFFRASNVESIQGTGLGLNIVKQYISLLGGYLTFESEEGKGSTFQINIPNYKNE